MIFGKYQLLEMIGRGGMAEVFKAKSYGVEGFEKLLVIKRILPNLTDNDSFVEMFINEAKIAVALNHANIVQVFDLGKVADSYFIAMEYVQGMDLATMLKAVQRHRGKVPVEIAAFVASEVAKGLDYAHRRRDQNLEPLNIIHRDISPHNVLLSYEGEVKITDFGIAQAKSTLIENDEGVVKGKYSYMAPEQARGKAHDRRVDIFALGVVLYELLSGENPIRGGQVADILRRVRTKDYPALHEHPRAAGTPLELSTIVMRAMEPDPADRYEDAGALYEALISFLYNTGTRVGVHSLTAFLEELREEEDGDGPEEASLREAFGGAIRGGTAVTATGTSEIDDDEITSVQVPTSGAAGGEDTSTTTGTRSLAAELRDVTVMAVEFVGPSASKDVLEQLSRLVEQNGGSLVEKRGDLLVGIFGIEVADGRDTQDAIDTALKVQRAAMVHGSDSSSLQIGVGVHPDKIVLNASGLPREDDAFFKAVSSARELAKRGVGWVATSEAGRVLANDSFVFDEITITAVGGVEQVMCKVVGRRPVAETYGPLFGRREELRRIGEALAIVSRSEGNVLALVGETGMGRTRIMHEVQRRLITGGHDVGWYEALCAPWRHDTPFAAVAAMFRSILAVSEIEHESELRAKVERLRELGLIPEEVDAVAVLLGVSASSNVGPDERGRQLRSALIRAASSLCADKITILFWDDVNFIDAESLEILSHLSRSMSHLPLLLAVTYTPEFGHEWHASGAYNEIRLNPLSESDCKRLSRSRMQARKVPDDLLMDIALKSSGNPLYIEEYVKALLANDVIKVRGAEVIYSPDRNLVDLPKTLRGLVGDRIKRLPPEQRGLLQRSAVIGQRFHVDLLSHVTGLDVAELRSQLLDIKDLGLLVRISAGEFGFASDLVRDVVYESMIPADRKEIHAAVAAAIEEMFGDRIEEFVERLAVHFREGGARAKAVEYLVRAGEKVSREYSHRAALDYYLTATDLMANVPVPDTQRILELHLPIGELAVASNAVEVGLEKMAAAQELAEDLGDKRTLIQIMRITAELHSRADQLEEAQQYFQRAIELADEMGDKQLQCEVRVTAGKVYVLFGDMKKAAPYYREVIDIWPSTGDRDLLVWSLSQLGKAEANAGDADQALATIAEAERLIDASTSPLTRCEFERCKAQALYMRRDLGKSVAHSLKALDIAKEYDLKDQIAANAHNLGDDYVALGDFRKAFTYLRFSTEAAEEIGLRLVVNLNKIFLAFIDALKFGSDEGLEQLEDALAVANERQSIWEQVQVNYFLGRIHFERKQHQRALTHLEQSLRISRAAENKIYEAQAVDLIEQIKEIPGVEPAE